MPITAREDLQLGRACVAYNAQVMLSSKTIESLSDLQDQILARVKSPLWKCPPASLHVSITPFLGVRTEYAQPKETLWEENRRRWTQALKESVHGIRNWTLCFRNIRITNTAVIVVAEDGESTNSIRRQLALQESQDWNLVHTTIFRFASNYVMPEIDEITIGAQRVDIEQRVKEIVILKERVYPSIDCEVLERIAIKSDDA